VDAIFVTATYKIPIKLKHTSVFQKLPSELSLLLRD